jgi:hypothetical protein
MSLTSISIAHSSDSHSRMHVRADASFGTPLTDVSISLSSGVSTS